MIKQTKADSSQYLAEMAVHGMQEKKANDIVSLDLRQIKSTVSDFFIICHADSTTQVRAIADSVEDEIYKTIGEEPWHKEGHQNCEWICLDYSNVVVHIFRTEKRQFYGIEDLWGDAQIKQYKSA